MKLTKEQEALMRRLCMERKGNAEIASAVGVPINEVCEYCEAKENCGEVKACAPALAKYIRTEEFSCGK